MKKNPIAFILLYPFYIIYGGIISFRNILYEAGLLKATSFSIPVINVGNLSIGGTGKTPHIEYLIRLLAPYINVATLSRGYKRKSKGFRLVKRNDDARIAGDEPLQFKRKYPSIPVAVSESRNIGIPLILKSHPEVQTILLDDAFQHRSVIPGMNILLTQYSEPFFEDHLLPVGTLREPRESYERADLIIVTKCPHDANELTFEKIRTKLSLKKHQELFFTRYDYKQPYFMSDPEIKLTLDENLEVILISAIAKVDYLEDYLSSACNVINVIKYEDHHYFTDFELEQFKKIYDNLEHENSVFITTEKDAMRLDLHRDFLLEHKIPIFILPVEVAFIEDKEKFDTRVKDFLLEFMS